MEKNYANIYTNLRILPDGETIDKSSPDPLKHYNLRIVLDEGFVHERESPESVLENFRPENGNEEQMNCDDRDAELSAPSHRIEQFHGLMASSIE